MQEMRFYTMNVDESRAKCVKKNRAKGRAIIGGIVVCKIEFLTEKNVSNTVKRAR